ncbi:hypothetical protein [Pectobacterium odoriferum]|uniref:hypothetical protein n=1 Tax=Pectobacterium odoriferum TaxID=78398 RepID=UPI0004FF6630|nr:hypothetical protein [Pectobacterium odoriferum]KGA30246.1 hypothetical protein KS43_20400 [Pectobacterium odoriferum]
MARQPKQIEVPGGAENTTAANTPEQLNAATAGATVLPITTTEDPAEVNATLQPTAESIAARNAALSELPSAALAVLAKFEAMGFTDLTDQPLTDNIEFIELVKLATTSQSTTAAIVTEDGQRKTFSAPVLTDHGWLVK